MRMPAAHKEVVLDHLACIANVAAPRHKIAPLAMQIDEYHVCSTVQHEQPHHREMPVASACKPAAECGPVWNRLSGEWITAECLTATREHRISVEYLQPASDHDHECNCIHPVSQSNEPVVSIYRHEQSSSRSASKRKRRFGVKHIPVTFTMAKYVGQCILDSCELESHG